jgi:ABC-type glutathione transport system ATPase component
MLELKGLTRRYGDLIALDDLSFTVAEGQMFGFVGSNGAGKTTAMRIILGVLAPDAGEVRWRGRPMTDEIRKRLGYLPEDHGQTFSTQFARLKAPPQPTLCQVGQQPQHPPTSRPCRCGKTQRHAREEQPAVQVRRRQVALNAQARFAFPTPAPTGRSGRRRARALLSGCPATRPPGPPCRWAGAGPGARRPRWRPRPGGQR